MIYYLYSNGLDYYIFSTKNEKKLVEKLSSDFGMAWDGKKMRNTRSSFSYRIRMTDEVYDFIKYFSKEYTYLNLFDYIKI